MRVSVVSDIHGNIAGLAEVAAAAEQLVVLGDLLDYVDYYDPAGGILGEVFGADAVRPLIDLRRRGQFEAFHAHERSLWATVADPTGTLEGMVHDRYADIVAVLDPSRTLVTLGNVDVRDVWDRVAPPGLRCLDGVEVDLDGSRFGFVGGGALREPPSGSPWRSFDRTVDEFATQLGRLSAVDVLCTHLPPRIHELRYDTVAEREEMSGPGVVEYLERHQPALSVFGHVHHPAQREVTLGRTRCVNVGYFKREGCAFTFETGHFQA